MTIKDKLPSFSKISEKLTIMKFSHSNFLKIFPHFELFELFCNTRLFQKSLLIIEMTGRFKNLLPTDNFEQRFRNIATLDWTYIFIDKVDISVCKVIKVLMLQCIDTHSLCTKFFGCTSIWKLSTAQNCCSVNVFKGKLLLHSCKRIRLQCNYFG